MNRPAGRHAPGRYQLRIQGHLDEHWAAWFAGLTLVRDNDGTTILRGGVADQAELHGLLAKVRDLGATLISVTPLDDDVPDSQSRHHPLTSRPSSPIESE